MVPLASSSTSTLLVNEDKKQELCSGGDFRILEKIVADSAFNIASFLKSSSTSSAFIWTKIRNHEELDDELDVDALPDADPINDDVPVLMGFEPANQIAAAGISEAIIASAAIAEAVEEDEDEDEEDPNLGSLAEKIKRGKKDRQDCPREEL